MLGQITPDANFMLYLLGTVGYLLLLIDRALSIASRSKRQKREVSFAEEFARREELTRVERNVEKLEGKLEHAVESIRAEMKADRETLLAAGEERAVKLHERINAVLGGVERIAGKIER